MNQQEIETWLRDVRQEKDKGALVTEHDIDAIIELLVQAKRDRKAIQDVIALRDELAAPPDVPTAMVSKAFADEIDRALKGQR